jgi:TRAP-type C4-dicarboxylate transport system permease small subunit
MTDPSYPKWFRGVLKVSAGSNILGTIWIFVIMFVMTGDVLGRLLLNSPIAGTPEIVRVSLVGILFLQLADTFWTGRVIRCDVVTDKMGAKGKTVIDVISYLLGTAMFVILFIASLPATIQVWKLLEYEGEGALRVPIYPIRTLILIGSGLTAILFAYRLYQSVQILWGRKRAGVL